MAQNEDIETKRLKLEYFLTFKLKEKIEESLCVYNEPVEIAILQRPRYDELDKLYYSHGLLKIGKRYYPMLIKADEVMVDVISK
ncbi:MAG: hypothetical protein OWQ50_03125, partial [Acidianus infernus]|nr:hypothetical protein [Acidianus infernus]